MSTMPAGGQHLQTPCVHYPQAMHSRLFGLCRGLGIVKLMGRQSGFIAVQV
jgi:hypothetical protein